MVHFIRFDAARRKIPHEIGGSTTLRIGNRVYVLTGVLVHEGESATSGHYYCNVVCPPHEQTGLAYQCNDAAYPSLIEEELSDDFKVAYMHIYELETGNEAAPIANTLGSDTRKRKSGEKLPPQAINQAEKQQRMSGLQANSKKGDGTPIGNCTGSISTSEEQQRRGGLQATDMELQNPFRNKCQQCGKSFKRSDFLKQHQRLVHMKVRNHACDICGKRFGHKGHITRHRECVHSGKKRGSICHYVHQSQVNKLRVKNRQGRKKIKMDKCQTQDRGRLRRHLRH